MSFLLTLVLGTVVSVLIYAYIKINKDDVFRYNLKCVCGYHKGVLKCPRCSEDMRWYFH